MDPMVGLNIVTLIMASISLALSSLSALPHFRSVANVVKRWFLQTRDAISSVMAVVGVFALVLVGVNFFAGQMSQQEFGVTDADSAIAPPIEKKKTSLSELPAARPDATESKRWDVEPIDDATE
jgi:hypothetical protein